MLSSAWMQVKPLPLAPYEINARKVYIHYKDRVVGFESLLSSIYDDIAQW
jgi:hypothetical protein